MTCISFSYPKQIENLLELDFRKIFSKVRVLAKDFIAISNQKLFKHPKCRNFSSIHVRSLLNMFKTLYYTNQKKYQQQHKLLFCLMKAISMKPPKRLKIMTLQFAMINKKISKLKCLKLFKFRLIQVMKMGTTSRSLY